MNALPALEIVAPSAGRAVGDVRAGVVWIAVEAALGAGAAGLGKVAMLVHGAMIPRPG